MMDGEALTVLLEWTIHGFSDEKELGLPASQSKTWLAARSFWQSWVKENEPQHIPENAFVEILQNGMDSPR